MLESPQHKILIFKHSRADNSAVRGRICSKFELIRDVMDILVTSKNKEEPNNNEGASVATTLNIDFSNTRGQITPRSDVGSGRNSNSFEMLRLSLLLPRIKKIRIKMKDLAEILTHPRCDGYPCYFQV